MIKTIVKETEQIQTPATKKIYPIKRQDGLLR